MDQETLANSLIHAATEVFGTMLGHEIAPGKAYVEHGSPTMSERVVALIGLAGQWVGAGMLSCSPQFACKIASALLVADCAAVTEDVLDVMAEMSNMIYGGVKTDLEEQLGPLHLSIPTVIFGRNFATKSVGPQSWTVVRIMADNGEMDLKICLARTSDLQIHPRAQLRPFALQQELT
jgi:chemotaxis protein CheX